MASVTLEHAWLHLADELDTYVLFRLNELSESQTRDGRIGRYAGGRRRVIVGPGRSTQLEAVFVLAERGDADTLMGWLGRKLLWRDLRGRVEFVTFLSGQIVERAGHPGRVDVSVVFQSVSGTVEV